MTNLRQVKNASEIKDLLNECLNARTYTRKQINTTAVNNMTLFTAAYSCSMKARTVTFKQLASFVVDILKVTSAFHKADDKKRYETLTAMSTSQRLKNKEILKDITAKRLLNHTLHHSTVLFTHKYLYSVNKSAMTITFSKLFVELMHKDKTIQSHTSQLTKELKAHAKTALAA